MIKYICFIAILLQISERVYANWNIKFRAREHFVDSHKFEFEDGSEAEYSGLSNTLNIWQEVPFKYSIGLSISPILGQPRAKDGNNAPLGSRIQFRVYGMELKYFPLSDIKIFTRLGVGYTQIKGEGPLDGIEGSSYYGGMGWELPIWNFYIAPEIGYRSAELSKNVKVVSQVVSVGFHFYK